MREIKFRAWDYESRKMISFATLAPRIHEAIYRWDKDDNATSLEVMQYTGLRDKNGNEIYEGDIVCWVTDVIVEQIEGHNRYEPEGFIGLVEFENGSFYVKGKDFYSYGEQMFLWSELEIIGNIYENPELLS